MPVFTDSLEMKLKLTVGSTVFSIPGGNIKAIELNLQPYGFTSMLSFWVPDEESEDELFPLFTKQDLIRVNLAVSPHFITHEPKPEPLILQGLVTDKDILAERTIENVKLKGQPVLYRHYRIVFADPAYVLWRQHFPCDLMTDKSVKDLIEAHRGPHVSLKYDWDILNQKFAINALPLGMEENTASFYDFVFWFVSSQNGVLSYDCNKNVYTLSADKPDIGKSVMLDKLDVEDLRIEFPPTIRNNLTVLNSCSEKAQRKVIEQKQAVDGIRHDHLVRFSIPDEFEKCNKLEENKLKLREHEISLTFQRFPQLTYRPGCLFNFDGDGWSDQIFPHGRVYRVQNIHLDAKAVAAEITDDHNMPYAGYNIEMASQLELESEKWVCLPPFKPPVFPLYVEGKVVSEQGEDDAETYQIYQDADTSLDQYRVAIPLWENQQVVLPFEPVFFTGHFYFPGYKYARVLVALDFHSGRIERFLDWRPGARLPMDTQGNHILFGKNANSETSVGHTYVDNKPELNIKRTSDQDTEMIKMAEGYLILETKEKDEE
jgi:hypothetical protein